MGLLKGYWRAALTSSIYSCLNFDACGGGLTSSCIGNTDGPLCNLCSVGYYKSDSNSCTECPAYSVTLTRLLFALFVISFFGIAQFFVIVNASTHLYYTEKKVIENNIDNLVDDDFDAEFEVANDDQEEIIDSLLFDGSIITPPDFSYKVKVFFYKIIFIKFR